MAAPALLETTLRRIPQWSSAPDLRCSFLAGGITNLNYRVEVDGENYVVRISGADSELLGIDRRCEHAAHAAAASLGIAPEVFYVIEPEKYLVTRFIDGRPLSPEELGLPENIGRVAGAMRQYHALPPIACSFSPFHIVAAYATTARSHQVPFPEDFPALEAQLNAIEASFRRVPFSPQLCHNDLLNANFLDDGRLRILDWEYAGMGDIYFDLGNFAVHHGFSDEQESLLLERYFGGPPTSARVARLKLMKIASDFREAMWGLVQIGISKLDFDFRGYAEQHVERLRLHLGDLRVRQWLEDAGRAR